MNEVENSKINSRNRIIKQSHCFGSMSSRRGGRGLLHLEGGESQAVIILCLLAGIKFIRNFALRFPFM